MHTALKLQCGQVAGNKKSIIGGLNEKYCALKEQIYNNVINRQWRLVNQFSRVSGDNCRHICPVLVVLGSMAVGRG